MSSPEATNKESPNESSAQVSLYIVVPPETHPGSFGIKAISFILGGENLSSRLNRNLRLKKGLAYSCSANYSGDYNAGVLSINAMVPAIKLEESIDTIFEEIRKLRTEKISEIEAELGKRKVRFRIARGFDSNSGHLEAVEEKLDNNRTVEEIMEEYNRLTPEIVQDIAFKYLPEDREKGKYVLGIRDPLKKNGVK